jgi:hypothetical protein
MCTNYITKIFQNCFQAAGLVWRCGVLDWLRIPRVVARTCDLTFGRLLRSQAPSQGALGATLELQRQQQMELLEQQLQINRARDNRTRHVSQFKLFFIDFRNVYLIYFLI